MSDVIGNAFSGYGANALLVVGYIVYKLLTRSKCHYKNQQWQFDWDDDDDDDIEKNLKEIYSKYKMKKQETLKDTTSLV